MTHPLLFPYNIIYIRVRGDDLLSSFIKAWTQKLKRIMSQQEAAATGEEEVGKLAIRLANAAFLPMALKSVLELNLLDIISGAGDGAFLSPSEISAQLPTKNPDAPVMLDRVLRLLASYSILKCTLRTGDNGEVERLYGVEPICKFLIRNHDEGSVGPLLLLHHDKDLNDTWYHLNDAILEGGSPVVRTYGMPAFEYSSTNQRFNKLLNRAMLNHTILIMKKILDVYKGFEGLKVLVDVGGGYGVTLNSITTKYPHIKGINFDLPHVVADGASYLGVEHVGGDMFVRVPKGDAIFMKWILHNWSDDHCLKILKNCWEALPNSGTIIVVESILPSAPENNVSSHIAFEQDLIMLLSQQGGKERTLKEFEALALKSGFSGCEVICSAYNSWVMEFHK